MENKEISYYLALLIISITTFVLILIVLWKKKVSNFPSIPTVPSLPLIGSPYYFPTDPHEYFLWSQELSKQKNYLYVSWYFYQPVVQSGRAEFAEFILSSQEILKKSFFYDFFHLWLGTGLLTSTGDKWRKRRRAITPTFHFSILNEFQKVFVEQSEVFVKKLKAFADTDKSFDIQPPISLATLDIICETAMGVSVNAQNDTHSTYVESIHEVNKEIHHRQQSFWLWHDFLYNYSFSGKRFMKHLKVVHDFTINVINDRIKTRNDKTDASSPSGRKRKAFLDMLLDLYDKGEIDVEGIREEVDTFMFEGHDTTASGLSWTLYCLGNNLDVQRKLHSEIDRVSGEDGELIEKIKSLKYLDYVIKEGLRLHPPVPYFGRTLEKDTVIDNVKYPTGTEMVVESISLHTNPEYWDKPLEFYPERFGEEKFLKRNPYCYVPFSAGPRNCIGQKFAMLEEKILLYHIMLNFEIYSTQKEEDVGSCFEIIHKSNNGLHVKLLTRK